MTSQGNGNCQQSIIATQSQSLVITDTNGKRNIRLTRISIVIVVIFIICHVPRMIPNVAEMAGVDTIKYYDYFTVILSINQLLLTINSTVNYIIYFILCGRRQQSNTTSVRTSVRANAATGM